MDKEQIILKEILKKLFKKSLPPIIVKKNNLSFKVAEVCHEGPNWWLTNYIKWEKHTFDIFDKLLKKDMIYLDIGTFSGQTVLYAAQKVNKVYAVELDPNAYKACRKNIQVNEYSNVVLEHAALSDTDGETFIEKSRVGSSGCYMIPQGEIKVNSYTIESLMKKWKLDGCDFIKMDIEGGEEICLPAMKSFFKKYNPLFYLSVHKELGANSKTIVDSTKNYKYVYDQSYSNIKENLYEIINSQPSSHGEQDYLFSNKPIEKILNMKKTTVS